jgi:carboxyl-terminal processing protease
VSKDFTVDDAMLADFRAYLDQRKLRYTEADLKANREALSRLIQEEILRQAFGEAEVRRRTMAWDPQLQKALDLVPKAEELLRDPQRFVAERAAERRQPRPEAASGSAVRN